MSLLGNAVKSSIYLLPIKPTHSLPYLLRQLPRRFSTGTEQPPVPPPPHTDDSSVDPFLQMPNKGLGYGRLWGGPIKYALRTDIINLLEGCNLTLDDVKVNYSKSFLPVGMLVQFHSREALDTAFKVLNKKGRLFRLEKIDRSDWDNVMPYNGRFVLLEGIPQNANSDDITRFLAGCEYDASSLHIFARAPWKIATVRFPTQTQAMNAFLTRNRGFCLNNKISVRVLQ